jgi:hypothetical protein
MTEIIVTLPAFSPSLCAPARADRSPLFWRRLFDSLMKGRQRKADACIADYLQHCRSEYRDQLRAALEQHRAR